MAPRRGTRRTRPSRSSRCSASRTGVRETPSSAAICSCLMRASGASRPPVIASRSAAQTRSVSCCWSSRAGSGIAGDTVSNWPAAPASHVGASHHVTRWSARAPCRAASATPARAASLALSIRQAVDGAQVREDLAHGREPAVARRELSHHPLEGRVERAVAPEAGAEVRVHDREAARLLEPLLRGGGHRRARTTRDSHPPRRRTSGTYGLAGST